MKKIIFQLYLILSLVLVVPLSTSLVFAERIQSETVEQVNQDCGAPTNVKDSLILSVVSLCLPGILEKTYEWKQIKCQNVVCYYEAVSNELDPSFCIDQYSYQTCNFIVGDIFTIPPMAMLDYYREAISNLLANPVGAAWSITAKLARNYLNKCVDCRTNIVGPSILFLFVTDLSSLIQTFRDMSENGFITPGGKPEDYCEQIPEIKEEMEKIIESMTV